MSRAFLHRAGRTAARGLSLVLVLAHGWVEGRAATTAGLTIDHLPPSCLAAEKYAGLSACFRPDQSLARGRVYFRPEGGGDWFYVEMTGEPPCLQAVLPRPRKELEAIEYYVSGVDRELAEAQTIEYVVQVSKSDSCRGGPMASIIESAHVIIGSASGAEPVEFLTGDGPSTGLILGVTGGAVAIAAVAVLAGGGEETPPTTTVTRAIRAGISGPGPSQNVTSSWRSELEVAGGRGQVVVDGAQASCPNPGVATPLPFLIPGPHRIEAALVEGKGQPGSWRFDLSALEVVPGSVRVIAGEVTGVGPDHVGFRLTGRPGERVVFTLVVEGD